MSNLDQLSNSKFDELIFMKTKSKKDKINYLILDKNKKKIKIHLKNVQIPFGFESYNNLQVLNIEILPQKSNDHFNIKALVSSFEDEFKNNKISFIGSREYYPNIRENKEKNGNLIRSYVYKSPEIFCNTKENFKIFLTSNNIIRSRSNVELELGTLWMTDNNYGIIWNVKSIEFLNNY